MRATRVVETAALAVAAVTWILPTSAFDFAARGDQTVLATSPPSGENSATGDRSSVNPLTTAEFRRFMEDGLEKWHVPGMSVAMVDGDSTWAEGFGFSELVGNTTRTNNTRTTGSTLFYTGSTTKAFAAAAMALMVESGNYSAALGAKGLRTPISDIIGDDFAMPDDDDGGWSTRHLTLEDAMSHRTGMPRHDNAIGTRYAGRRATPRDIARAVRHLPAVLEPRTEFRYCNIMYLVVTHVIETLRGGAPLGRALVEWIWGPLGMNDTFFELEEALESERNGGAKIARGYYWDYRAAAAAAAADQHRHQHQHQQREEPTAVVKEEEEEEEEEVKGNNANLAHYESIPLQSSTGLGGAGATISSVADYAKWMRCLIGGSAPLPPAVHAAVRAPRMPLPGARGAYDADPAYALGWVVATYRGRRLINHSGGTESHGTDMYIFPDDGFGVVSMGNTAVTGNVAGMLACWRLIDEKLGVPAEERFDWAEVGKREFEKRLHAADTAVERLFPDRASPPLPRALPLAAYEGTYFNPGYQNMTITMVAAADSDSGSNPEHAAQDDGQQRKIELRAPRVDGVLWKTIYEFEHVSGEFFVVYLDFARAPNGLMEQFARAEFKVGVGGTVDAVEMEFNADGEYEGKVRFDRVV